MEVEEEKTPNHLQESTTTVTNDSLLENISSNDKELEKEVQESDTQEEKEESSFTVPKLDDPNPFVAVAVAVTVGEIAEEEEVIAQRRNTESSGCGNSVVVESTNVLKDEKDGDEGAIRDEIPTRDVAAVGFGGSELTNSAKEVSESNAQEEKEESSVTVFKLDDPKPFAAVAVGEIAEEVIVQCRNLVSGGCGNSVEVGSTKVLKDEKEGDEGAVKDEIPTSDVAAVECGGSELTNWAKVDGGCGNSLAVESTNVLKDEKEGDVGAVKDEIPTSDVAAVECGGSELTNSAKVDGGCGNSVAVESMNVLKDEKEGDVGAVKDEIPTSDVAVVECGGSELTNSGKIDGGESEAAVIVRDNGLHLAEENVKNCEEATNTNCSLVTEKDKDGDEGEMETVKVEEDGEVLKDGGGVDGPLLPVAEIGEREEVIAEVKNDGGVDTQKENLQIVQGDEAMTECQVDVQEGVNAEVVKEEGIVANEEEPLGVEEGVKEEGKMANEEKVVGVTENDEEEAMLADEEKSLDTEFETEEEATMADEEKVPDAEIEMETETVPESSIKSSAGKRKRGGKNSKTTPKSTAAHRKMTEEDVCFICFDGGDLVLCDRRNCPKAYHPSCVNRDAAFFRTKGQWNCGWHQCSICEKKAEYMCYTCTFSLCKACIKTNVILCVREKEKKGFCETCMKTVMLIEKNSQENQGNVDFDDKGSWEYLFKDYWTDMKAQLNLSLAELVEAKNAWKGSELAGKQEHPAAQSGVKEDGDSGSENPSENLETRKNRRSKAKKRKSVTKDNDLSTGAAAAGSEGTAVPKNTEWASKELLEFVMHMGNGNKSIRSQFDVQALLLEYIKTNNLRDSRRKSQIICDARLERLFGKPRVGHFEMLKLLESHFLIKEDSQMDDIQGSVVDTDVSQVDDDETNETIAKGGKDRKRKMRKKGDRGPQSNREDYAAIDIHNISLIYLRRKLVEDLLDDPETFRSKIVGTFVRIRISGANHKDMYRLVQVAGTTKAAQYTLGKKMTDTMLEILNLDKTESISIDTISNQDFTEDECKRLRQSIKCGLINRLTVGDILDKAMELQAARVNDWLETEVMRLSHLRDRASDLGRKKELRECVEKLQVLKTPEERARRLEEFPIIHADPAMDPNYGSEDDTDTEDKKQDLYKSSAGSGFSRRQDYPLKEAWSGTGTPRSSGKNYEFSRNLSNKSFSHKVEATSPRFEPHNENLWDQGRDTIVQQPSILKIPSSSNDDVASPKDISETAPKVNETEKMWHYKDPSGKIQGPFSMVQLRKWSNNKYFPADLRIWRKSEKEDNRMLLTDVLEGRFTLVDHSPQLQNSHLNWVTTSVEIPKPSPDGRRGFANLPSPTPNQSIAGLGEVGPHVGPSSYHSGNEGLQSPTPSSAQLAISSVAGGNKEPNAMGSFGVSAFPSLDSPSTVSVPVAPQNSEQQNSLQSSHSGHLIAPPSNNMPPQMAQSVASQNLPVGHYGWSGGPPQNLQPSPSSNMAGQQQQAYNHWGSVPNMVQHPAGNFLPQSAAGLQQPPPPVNLQQPPPPLPLQPQPQPQANVSWPTMTGNANMGLVGPTPGNQGLNWGPTVQGPQLTGNANPPWALQAGAGNVHPGWVPAPPAQGVAPNQGWVTGASPTPGPIASGNGNPNWVIPPGNQGAPPNPVGVASAGNQGLPNTSTGWVGGPGNQGAPTIQVPGPGNTDMDWASLTGNQGLPPGNSNQGWASPAPRNRAMWDGSEQHQQYNRSGFSGQKRNRGSQSGGSGFRGNRRHWDKPGPFNNRGRSRDSARSSEH